MLDTTLAAAPDTGTATAAQIWARLATAIEAADLPVPSSITVGRTSATVYLHDMDGHTATDLHTWVAWLGAHNLTTKVYGSSQPGYMQRDTSAKATWRGWDITAVLIEVVPVETVAVAYGQATPPVAPSKPADEATCASKFISQGRPCDGPAILQVTYRSSKDYDRVLNISGPLCRAHAQHESDCAYGSNLIAPHSVDPWNGGAR